MLCSCFSVDDRDVCQFVENHPLLLRIIKEEMVVQIAIVKVSGQYLTPTQRRKVVFRTYTRLTHGFLGCDVRRHPIQCTMDTVRGFWVSLSGSRAGYHKTAATVGDSSDNDKGNRDVKNKGKDFSENDKYNRAVKRTRARTPQRMIKIIGLSITRARSQQQGARQRRTR
jgi:hypothetical protein